MTDSTRFRVNRPYVVKEDFDDEDVIVNLDSGTYYSLNKSGAMIWALMEAGACERDIVTRISGFATNGNGQVKESVSAMLKEFEAEGLISPATVGSVEDRSADIVLGPDGTAPEFSKPVLQKFTDMQDMLLLDPVHDVDESGWPAPRADTPDG